MTKFTLEVGKTYLTRQDERVRIDAETENRGTYRMRGEDEQGRVTWRSLKGRFTDRPHALDLIAEAI